MSYSRVSSGDSLPLYNSGDISWNSSKSVTTLGMALPVINSQDNTDLSYYEALFKQRILGSNKWVNLILHVPKSVFVTGLLSIFATSYLLSLQAGDLEYIKEHLSIIGAELLASVISLTAVTVMLYAGRMRSNTRRGALLIILCIFATLYCYDHSERFEHHGFYSLLAFLAIFVSINLTIALVDGDGVLRMACESEDKDVFVDVLPETRQWPLKDKDMWNVFNHLVLKRVVCLPYSSSRPFVLNETTQAVVVRCGSSSTIVTRVSPSLAKLPMYTPPSDSDTHPSSGSASAQKPAQFNVSETPQMRLERPNVVYLMLDAVSHCQFYRQLPKSAQVLKSIHHPDNNTMAAYIGEIYPLHPNPLPIWAHYCDRGYVTARVETGCDDWAELYLGGKYKSKEYSVGNRSLDYELTSPFCLPEYYPNVGNAFGNFKGLYSLTARCLYGRYVHD
ncbi:hypothetical protein H4R27_001410 [Coemansia aciculifera]|nr:hypothetical protein H4R27_001410 [Coemansia aciculifera]